MTSKVASEFNRAVTESVSLLYNFIMNIPSTLCCTYGRASGSMSAGTLMCLRPQSYLQEYL